MFVIRALNNKVSDLTTKPWRIPDALAKTGNEWKWNDDTYQKLLEGIAETQPPDSFKGKKLNILVIGPKSHGKSSFINSVASLSIKERTTVANSGAGAESSTVTTHFRRFNVEGDFQSFRLCDVPGLTKQKSVETLIVNLKLLIDGHIKPDYEFKDKEPISPDDESYKCEPTTEDKIHGVIIVFDITETYEIHKTHRDSLATIKQKLNKMNIPLSVVLTKADLLDPLVRENIENIYYSKRVSTAVKNTNEALGVPMKNIHPVVNFEDTNTFVGMHGLPLLVAVRACLRMATSHLFCEETSKKEANKK